MRHWKINFIIFICVVSVATLAMLFTGIGIVKDLKVKQAQINVLIDEIGILKGGSTPAGEATNAKLFPMITEVPEQTKNQESYLLVGQHSGLTDTIILAIKKDSIVTLVSIPRDFAINGRKINEFYEFFGPEKLAEEVTGITGLPIHKYVIIDMKAFSTFIDAIGGIDVVVERGISDYMYPKNNIDYETFSISAGPHHLDGDTALKYARSRKTTSDFDRSRRQQDIIKAVKVRLEQGDFLPILKELYGNLTENVTTNISFVEAAQLATGISGITINPTKGLDTTNYLYQTYNKAGQYILLPKTGDYTDIQKQIQDWISGESTQTTASDLQL